MKLAHVAYWHLADVPTAPAFVRFWSNGGQWLALALDGSAAIDPKRTSLLLRNRRSVVCPFLTRRSGVKC
jgi:hypothetical protein